MNTETKFDYCYGEESGQFSFCRIPRQLITGEAFKRLSTDAKLLYRLSRGVSMECPQDNPWIFRRLSIGQSSGQGAMYSLWPG